VIKSWRIQLVCEQMDHAEWVTLQNIPMSRESVMNTHWEFECPKHGRQREKPLQIEEKRSLKARRKKMRAK
jgi:hypothetical protein